MSVNHSDMSELKQVLKSVFESALPAKIRVLFLRCSNRTMRHYLVSIAYLLVTVNVLFFAE